MGRHDERKFLRVARDGSSRRPDARVNGNRARSRIIARHVTQAADNREHPKTGANENDPDLHHGKATCLCWFQSIRLAISNHRANANETRDEKQSRKLSTADRSGGIVVDAKFASGMWNSGRVASDSAREAAANQLREAKKLCLCCDQSAASGGNPPHRCER